LKDQLRNVDTIVDRVFAHDTIEAR
jgi:hypothetical protein